VTGENASTPTGRVRASGRYRIGFVYIVEGAGVRYSVGPFRNFNVSGARYAKPFKLEKRAMVLAFEFGVVAEQEVE
jgi:hypothetical protein